MDTVTISEPVAEAPKQFKTLAEANAAYAELEISSQALTAEAASQIETLKVEQAEKLAEISQLSEKLTEAEAKAEALGAEIEVLKAEAQSVERKAAAMAASVGVDPVAVAPGGTVQGSGKTYLEQYNAISDPREKTRFFQQHEAEILSGR